LVEVHNFNEVGNSFHNFGPLCLTDFWRPIVVLQLSTYRLFFPGFSPLILWGRGGDGDRDNWDGWGWGFLSPCSSLEPTHVGASSILHCKYYVLGPRRLATNNLIAAVGLTEEAVQVI